MKFLVVLIAFYGSYASAARLDIPRCTEPGVYEEHARYSSRSYERYSITGSFKEGEGFLTYNNGDLGGKKELSRMTFCEAFYVCKQLGGRLPTVTELAREAQRHGASILNFKNIVNIREEVEGAQGLFTVIDGEDESQKQREVFAYSNDGFDESSYLLTRKEAFPRDYNGRVWSSSTAQFYYTNDGDYINIAYIQAYVMTESGWLAPNPKLNRNIVRCVLN